MTTFFIYNSYIFFLLRGSIHHRGWLKIEKKIYILFSDIMVNIDIIRTLLPHYLNTEFKWDNVIRTIATFEEFYSVFYDIVQCKALNDWDCMDIIVLFGRNVRRNSKFISPEERKLAKVLTRQYLSKERELIR